MRTWFLLALFVAALFASSAARAQWAVYDVANDIRNYISYAQQYQEYVEKVQHWRRQMENLSASDIRNLLLFHAGRDDRLGRSTVAALQYLDPNSAQWRNAAEDLLATYYALPERGLGSAGYDLEYLYGAAGSRVRADIDRAYARRAPALDVLHFIAAQERPSRDRIERLNNIESMLNSLRDRSEVQQLQAIGTALAVIGKQNEASLDAMHMMLSQQQMQGAQGADRKTRQLQAQILRSVRESMPRQPCTGPCVAEAW